MTSELTQFFLNHNIPTTLALFIYLFFEMQRIKQKFERLDAKVCVILQLIQNSKNDAKRK